MWEFPKLGLLLRVPAVYEGFLYFGGLYESPQVLVSSLGFGVYGLEFRVSEAINNLNRALKACSMAKQ